jgi:peptidoglycan/LPS O-acetylase OafA/YrhL
VDNRATRWLGERSYSFYLVHLAVLWSLGELLSELDQGYKVTLALLIPLSLAISALIADVLFRAVERPFLRRKQSVGRSAERDSLRLSAGGIERLHAAKR